MFTQLLLPLAAAFLFLLLWLVLRRRDACAQARDDFTQFMTVVHQWSKKQDDYQMTGRAITALTEHNDRMLLAEHSVKPSWLGSSLRAQYLAEYQRCQARHETLLTNAIDDESVTAQATELEQAIARLGQHIERTNY